MRLLAALAALASFSLAPPETDLPEVDGGIGFVLVADFDQTLAFYETPEDTAPSASVALSEESIPHPAWLLPDSWWVDYFLLQFRTREIREDGWARVIVHEETGREMWLRTDPEALPFVSWEQFLTEHLTAADRLDPEANPLRTAPEADAPLAPPPEGHITEGWASDCFLPVEVQGEWVRVVPSALCSRDASGDAPTLGWVRWRDGDRLLLSTFQTC